MANSVFPHKDIQKNLRNNNPFLGSGKDMPVRPTSSHSKKGSIYQSNMDRVSPKAEASASYMDDVVPDIMEKTLYKEG